LIVQTLCENPKKASGKYCEPFSILADGCTDMPKMSGCEDYTSMCSAGSVIKECTEYPPIPGLPTTSDLNAYIKSICDEMNMEGNYPIAYDYLYYINRMLRMCRGEFHSNYNNHIVDSKY
jgi:hypothetical protein